MNTTWFDALFTAKQPSQEGANVVGKKIHRFERGGTSLTISIEILCLGRSAPSVSSAILLRQMALESE